MERVRTNKYRCGLEALEAQLQDLPQTSPSFLLAYLSSKIESKKCSKFLRKPIIQLKLARKIVLETMSERCLRWFLDGIAKTVLVYLVVKMYVSHL